MENDNEQLTMLGNENNKKDKPVTVLGITFKNDLERRKYFTEELRKKLPEIKKNEGFPLGEDNEILTLSDPPYYTACPNPWINDFIEDWQKEKIEVQESEYKREPFASDVRDGRSHPVYMAHSYHTKTPHKSIMRFILNYTNPGDIVFDGFSGTGMTGVAARYCGDSQAVKDLGYSLDGKKIFNNGNFFSKLGERKSIINDLSPIASNIGYNYNTPSNIELFKNKAKKLLEEIEEKFDWMFKTIHLKDNSQTEYGKINYVVWSDVFLCPNCSNDINYWEHAVEVEANKINKVFNCKNCGVELAKNKLEKSFETKFDPAINKTIRVIKQQPVLINYTYQNNRYEKEPDDFDLNLIKEIEEYEIETPFPNQRMVQGDESSRTDRIGYTHVHHLYPKRNLIVLSYLYKKIKEEKDMPILHSWLTSSMIRTTKMYKFTLNKKMSTVSGTYYIPSLWTENMSVKLLQHKLRDFSKLSSEIDKTTIINTGSSSQLLIKENSIDYIFVDPPFGSNLMYSELNYIWESWLGIYTNNSPEAIISNSQSKKLFEYQNLMTECFKEFYRILKDGRWITVQFSSSQSKVWNSIQESLQRVGFVIANVSALDKKQGSFKAVTTTTAVKQDLVISAYKPSKKMIKEIKNNDGSSDTVWTFLKEHLEKLPVFIGHKGEAQQIVERTPRVLFDRMVAYHVQNGISVPVSSADFQIAVTQRFTPRDGMVFLENQVAEYDKKRILVKEFSQMSLFVSDENSAIEWLRQQLLNKPQSRQDLHPNFMKEIQHIEKHELLPELDELLEQNFLLYEGNGPVPDQIASYLKKNYKDVRGLDNDDHNMKNKAINRWYVPDPNKQADLEKLREKSLLREFESYIEEINKSKKKLKQFRTEAIRAGFKKAWGDKEYQRIVNVGERLPEKVIQEDDKLLMYYDNAQIRLGL
ncbi:DNA methyltransferase [Gracilibacillus xinjiangensis]|uniref:DNA methyltransferase n=1 Tax=Gracilibacillus xinjiangensis TaxID=1193282 RepID=A0ABV8WTF2_9BACI